MIKSNTIAIVAMVISFLSIVISTVATTTAYQSHPTVYGKSYIMLINIRPNSHFKVPVPAEGLSVSNQWGYTTVIFYDYRRTHNLDRVTVLGGDARDEPFGRRSFISSEVDPVIWDLWVERFLCNRNKVSIKNPHKTVTF